MSGTKTLNAKLVGATSLLVSNGRLANPLDSYAKRMKEVQAIKKKTDDVYAQLADLEWEASLYYDPKIGPFLPFQNIFGALKETATMDRVKPKIQAGIVLRFAPMPINYSGPREIESLRCDSAFRSSFMVQTKSGRILVTKPKFEQWSIDVSIEYMPEILNERDVHNLLVKAGKFKGIGASRKWGYGRFEVA